jgi:hypothetical protein
MIQKRSTSFLHTIDPAKPLAPVTKTLTLFQNAMISATIALLQIL